MSYRLIDSNAIAIKYPEVNEMPCVFANLPDGIHGQFIDAQPEPSKVARDIATIIENEKDMRVISSAQPERKTGRITYTHHSEELWGQSAICISCGCKWQIAEGGEDNFCPNCGCELER